jgi:hypothetical protein
LRGKTVEFDPNMAFLVIVSCGVGYLMVVAGMHKSLLEWRRQSRMCPSCGRAISERVCAYCTR